MWEFTADALKRSNRNQLQTFESEKMWNVTYISHANEVTMYVKVMLRVPSICGLTPLSWEADGVRSIQDVRPKHHVSSNSNNTVQLTTTIPFLILECHRKVSANAIIDSTQSESRIIRHHRCGSRSILKPRLQKIL